MLFKSTLKHEGHLRNKLQTIKKRINDILMGVPFLAIELALESVFRVPQFTEKIVFLQKTTACLKNQAFPAIFYGQLILYHFWLDKCYKWSSWY